MKIRRECTLIHCHMRGGTSVHVPVLIRLRKCKGMHDRINVCRCVSNRGRCYRSIMCLLWWSWSKDTGLAWRSGLPRSCRKRIRRLSPPSPRIKEWVLIRWIGLVLQLLVWCTTSTSACTLAIATSFSATAVVVAPTAVSFLALSGMMTTL